MSDIEAIRDAVQHAVDINGRYAHLWRTSGEFHALVMQLPHTAALVKNAAARTCQPDQVWRLVAGFIADALATYAADAEAVGQRRRFLLKQAMAGPAPLLLGEFPRIDVNP